MRLPDSRRLAGFPQTSLWQVQVSFLPELVAYCNARTEIPFAKIATGIRNKEMQSNGDNIVYTAARPDSGPAH
jgi:hypothetical protein